MSYVVVQEFKNKFNRSEVFRVGQDVSFLNIERLNNLVQRGLVQEVKGSQKPLVDTGEELTEKPKGKKGKK